MHPHTADAALPIIISLVLFVVVAAIAFMALMLVANWKVYVKAGRKGWEGLIPFYNYVVMLELTGEPLWWTALMFVPVANIVTSIIVLHRISRAFGHGGGFTTGLVLLPFIFWPILAFGSSEYRNTFPPAPAASSATKWALAAAGFYAFMYMGLLMASLGSAASSSGGHALSIIKNTGDDGYTYATDGTYVYANDQIVLGADPQSFHIEGSYEVDYESVYYAAEPIAGADVATFRTLDGEYAADAHAVYESGKAVAAADVRSFKVLDTDYAIDSANAYYDGTVIPNADPASFSVLGLNYAKDRVAVYITGTPVAGADPATFAVVQDPSGNQNYDARDKNHYYSYGEAVTKDGASLAQ